MTRISVSRVIVEVQERLRFGQLAQEVFGQAYADLRKKSPTGNAYLVLYVDAEDGCEAPNGCDSPVPELPPTLYSGRMLIVIWGGSAFIGAVLGGFVAWLIL